MVLKHNLARAYKHNESLSGSDSMFDFGQPGLSVRKPESDEQGSWCAQNEAPAAVDRETDDQSAATLSELAPALGGGARGFFFLFF